MLHGPADAIAAGLGFRAQLAVHRGRGIVAVEVSRARKHRLYFHIFERGLLVGSERHGFTAYPFDRDTVLIHGVRFVRRWSEHRFTLRLADGRELLLGNFSLDDTMACGNMIDEAVSRLQYADALRELLAGHSIAVGRSSISTAGVMKDGELVPWYEVVDVDRQPAHIVLHRELLYRKADGYRPPIFLFPERNPALIERLVRELRAAG
ncbi:MAG TPA: hypothetical protein VGM10_25235 [Actinocrinis sp.]